MQEAKQKAAQANNAKYARFQKRYFNNLAGFVKDCIYWKKGTGPTPYQHEILSEIGTRTRVSVRGPHGLGKTMMMAAIVLWFALTRDGKDWKVVTTASAWRQLEKYLWPEIHKWARALNWAKIGRAPFGADEIFTLKLRLRTGEAFAVASDNPALIEGAHADNILYIFDESKSIIPKTFDAAEGALTTPGAMAIAMSTPGEPNGRFYEIQSRAKGYEDWWCRHVKKEEVISAGRMTQIWADNRRNQWGAESAVYLNRVEGMFAASDEDSVIPLYLVERAIERWRIIEESGSWGPAKALGVDVARSGSNDTVIAVRHGLAVKELRKSSHKDTMQTAGAVSGIMKKHDIPALVDTVGLGAGVFDRLRELGLDAVAFTASARTRFMDKSGEYGFADVRSAAWWNLREMLESEEIALPPTNSAGEENMIGDLTAPKWRIMSGAKIRVESKDDIAKRLGRSTDDGDAVVQVFWDGMQVAEYGDNPLSGYRG